MSCILSALIILHFAYKADLEVHFLKNKLLCHCYTRSIQCYPREYHQSHARQPTEAHQSSLSAVQLLLKSPVLLEEELSAITSSSGLSTQTFRLRYTAGDADALATALKGLCSDVEAAVKAGCEVLVLSDRLPEGEEVRHPPPPSSNEIIFKLPLSV